MRSVKDLDLSGKTVLVRVDFNVPLSEGEVSDDHRIRAALPTINHLLNEDAKVVLISHLGRPDGRDDDFSLAPVAERLGELLDSGLVFVGDCVGEDTKETIDSLSPGQVCLLENLRFHDGETGNDPGFAEELASLADVYVNEAFGASHREHASIVGVPKHLPSAAGLRLDEEVSTINGFLDDPQRPFVVVLGGAKVSTKLPVITNLLDKSDAVLVGGAMMFTFLKALGHQTGESLVEDDLVDDARRIIKESGNRLVLPIDCLVVSDDNDDEPRPIDVHELGENDSGLDIGPGTIAAFSGMLEQAKTIIWNGPLGKYENPQFRDGTDKIADSIASSGADSLIGGGETEDAVKKLGIAEKFGWVSTGGGAMLMLLAGESLPGVEILEN